MDLMIPRLEKFATEGLFGEINFLRVTPSSDDEILAQFQSQLGFFEVDLVTSKGKVRKVPVVVKIQPGAVTNPDRVPTFCEQFANEVRMYEKIFPVLGATDLGIHPTMYYGLVNGKDPQQDLIVLEDLRPQGFKVPKEIVLDFDHITLAMKKLGEFHGLSYKLKTSSLSQFNGLKDLLVPKKIIAEEKHFELSFSKGFQNYLESSPEYSLSNKVYKKLTSKGLAELTERLRVPNEPFGVIVHGDFLKNNLLYKYDENGKPSEVKFIDFTTAVYADPSIDISLFLYLHTTPEDRADHWNDYLKSYWSGVTSMNENLGFTFEEFWKNFAQRAVYGYVICCLFLPSIQHNGTTESTEERNHFARNLGGEVSTATLTNIVRHLLEEDYLEEYLLHFK